MKKELSKLNGPIRFAVNYNPNSKRISIDYGDETEEFYSVTIFLSNLSCYYNNMIRETDSVKERIAYCDEFLWHINDYYNSFRLSMSRDERKDIEAEIEHYDKYYARVKEEYSRFNNSTPASKGYTLKQKIIIMEYCGILEELGKDGSISANQKAAIVSTLIESDFNNTLKALRNNVKIVLKGDDTKTISNLKAAIRFFDDNRLYDLSKKVQQDIDKSEMGNP